jgi:hypothetical protein
MLHSRGVKEMGGGKGWATGGCRCAGKSGLRKYLRRRFFRARKSPLPLGIIGGVEKNVKRQENKQ